MRKAGLFGIVLAVDIAIYTMLAVGCGGSNGTAPPGAGIGSMVVLGYNDLGMHCMNQDFSELCILPPANTLRAQVIARTGDSPQILTEGIQVGYSIAGNTDSASKTNFWQYAPQLFGVSLPNNVGLFGFGLSGVMQSVTGGNDFWAHGIPLTPLTDSGSFDPYQLAQIAVVQGGRQVASTQVVIPVSWEIRCDNCHTTPGISVAFDILQKHDKLHGTTLVSQKPVLCAKCHADPALGASGQAGVSTMSSAMHIAHAGRMGNLSAENICYSCHPGPVTQCLRDVHKANGLNCLNCHTSMAAVGDPNRAPWKDEPRCGTCHNVAGHEYEQPGVLYRDSVGHNGVKCISCHGSPHALVPSTNVRDNVQAIAIQGKAGPISKCAVCHNGTPEGPFNHTSGGGSLGRRPRTR